jgi:hypothetical protein
MLPAMALGCDWAGVMGDPPRLRWQTGLVKNERGFPESRMPNLGHYEIVVLQQPAGKGWLELIEKLQSIGVQVVYEVDDYLHGIKHMEDHDYQAKFGNEYLAKAEKMMKSCDALIASTPWIASNYRHFNKNVHICRNGIDLRRYDLTKPERGTVNIGWAGATGHTKAAIPWFQKVAGIMRMRPNTCFVSIGQDFAGGFAKWFGEERAITVPWAAIEQYPGAMTMFDIALAPGGKGGWWRGKSDLRWLEAAALGVPIVANPNVYPDIEQGVTGFKAGNPMEAGEYVLRLVDDADLRTEVGRNAREYVEKHRSIEVMASQWSDVFSELASPALASP